VTRICHEHCPPEGGGAAVLVVALVAIVVGCSAVAKAVAGAMVPILIGVIVLVVAAVAGAVCYWRRNRVPTGYVVQRSQADVVAELEATRARLAEVEAAVGRPDDAAGGRGAQAADHSRPRHPR
jgi:hypothetical protein